MGSVVANADLSGVLTRLRDQNAVIVTTNGCFDILHVGHLRYLQQARALGDILMVAVNSDTSVRRLKGPERPLVLEDDRAELLAGLACVDYVVLFDEDTPEALLKQIQPTIHVKGAQYAEDTLPETETLRAMGTRIAFLPMVTGRSSTGVIEKIREMVQSEASAKRL